MAKEPVAKKPAPKKKTDETSELVHQIGHSLLQDVEYEDGAWQAIVLIVELEEGYASVGGFRYDAKGKHTATIPENYDLAGDAEALCDIMEAEGGGRWKSMLIELTQPGPEIAIEFEYDIAGRWSFDFSDADKMAKKLRPKTA